MMLSLHKNATTTPAIRAKIASSEEPAAVRAAIARELVFGTSHGASDLIAPDAVRDVTASRGGDQNPTVVLASPNESNREHLVEATA